MTSHPAIPREFRIYAEKIESTHRRFIHIEPHPVDDDLLPWQSKYLGMPYMPKGDAYPLDLEGNPLYLLAQINFAEMPPLPGYPTQGVLQFFIANDDLYGLEFSEPYDAQKQFSLMQAQRNYRVIYYPQVITDASKLNLEMPDSAEPGTLPIGEECRLEFFLREEYVPFSDVHFEKLLGKELAEKIGTDDTLFDSYIDAFSAAGNKIGGYADFAQEDVRTIAPPEENWLLLLQIDSSEEVDIMWGDSGVGNFFIREQDLQALNFRHVLYNWDCA